MSDRERWTIYPLLFLSLLLHLKQGLDAGPAAGRISEIDCNRIHCNELLVSAVNGVPRVRVGSSRSQAGEVRIFDKKGQTALALHLDPLGHRGVVHAVDETGRILATLGSDASGGYLRLDGPGNVPSLFLGHDATQELSGLMARGARGQFYTVQHQDQGAYLWGSSFRWQQVPAPAGPQDADQAADDTVSDESTDSETGQSRVNPSDENADAADQNQTNVSPSKPSTESGMDGRIQPESR